MARFILLLANSLHQFDAVAERIIHVDAIIACKLYVSLSGIAGGFEPHHKRRQPLNQQGRMGLRRAGILFHAKVQGPTVPLLKTNAPREPLARVPTAWQFPSG